METNPRDYGERCRFDAFYKTVLRHEAIDYIQEMKRRASREMSLERLPQTAMDKLCAADSYVLSYCGYDLPISSKQVTRGKEVSAMKHRNYKGRELLTLAVSDAARAGDTNAVEQVLRYYEGYINKLCTRTVYDESGCPHACLDEYMKSRLENKLIRAILGVN